MIRLEERTVIHAPLERCFDLARSVEAHLAGNVHYGEQARATGGVTSGLIGLGQRVTWRARHFWIWHELTSEITAMNPPHYFQDAMIRGPFRRMRHDHHFLETSPGAIEMTDIFEFSAPFGVFGLLAETLVLRWYMRHLLRERNRAIREIAESARWLEYLPA